MYFRLYEKYIKRILDVILSFLAIVILMPLMLFVALLIRIKLGSPVIYKQKRPGQYEKIFTVYKFRSMTNQKDKNGALLPDEERITRFGAFLRNTSLDELPEFVNVLKGDMSLIGPRPLLVNYLPLYDEFQRKRHLVKPGIVGLAVVNGRNKQSWESKFKYDVEYVKNVSIILDVKIFIKAIITVLKRNGINEDGVIGSNPFTGNTSDKNIEYFN